jgi:hypothetical protein
MDNEMIASLHTFIQTPGIEPSEQETYKSVFMTELKEVQLNKIN